MNLERYVYFANNNYKDYEFYNIGPKGHIKKGVRFSKINDDPIIYNLAFGDISLDTDRIGDSITSKNNDRDLVLTTVANTIFDFTNNHGNHFIYATGSTSARTRLYQISIARLWTEISKDFEVYGFEDCHWQVFQKNVNYEAFLVKRK